METSVVYISGNYSKHNDIEIRYSIRSLVKHLLGLTKIFVVGHCPTFLKNVIHIPAPDAAQFNYAKNIYDKILRACQDKRVSNDFLCINTDHFLLKDFTIDKFPYFVNAREQTLEQLSAKLSPTNYYKPFVESTIKILRDHGLQTLNFNVHTPIIYNKKSFKVVGAKYNWTVKKGYIAKSLYGNSVPGFNNIIPIEDFKFHTPKERKSIERLIIGKSVLSTNEHSMNPDLIEVFNELYPQRSIHEGLRFPVI